MVPWNIPVNLNFFIINKNVGKGLHDWSRCCFECFTLHDHSSVYIASLCFAQWLFFKKTKVLTCNYWFRIFFSLVFEFFWVSLFYLWILASFTSIFIFNSFCFVFILSFFHFFWLSSLVVFSFDVTTFISFLSPWFHALKIVLSWW